MRRSVIVAVLVAAFPTYISAQSGNVGIFVDPAGGSCRLSDTGQFNVYVVHVGAMSGATGSSFRVVPSAGVTATWIFESSTYPKSGVSQTGVTLDYQACESGTFVVLSMIYMGSGTTPPCESLSLAPNPLGEDPTRVVIDDCSMQPQLMTEGYTGYFGGDDQSCSCSVPVEQHTWGAIKALYL